MEVTDNRDRRLPGELFDKNLRELPECAPPINAVFLAVARQKTAANIVFTECRSIGLFEPTGDGQRGGD